MKIEKKKIRALILIIFIILMQEFMYLIDVNKISVGPFKYSDIWLVFFILYFLYQEINNKKNNQLKNKFSKEIIILCIFVLIASIQSFRIIGQPIIQGLTPQRNFLILLLSYFPIRKLFNKEKICEKTFFKGILFIGLIQVILYCIQQQIYEQFVFVNVMANYRYGSIRLYIDTVIIDFMILLSGALYFKTYKLIYLIMIISGFIYQLTVSKGRLEIMMLLVSLLIGYLLARGKTIKSILLNIVLLGLFIVVLNLPFIRSFWIDIIDSIYLMISNNSDLSKNTMAIRDMGRELYWNELTKDTLSLVFGCGYPNINYEPALFKSGINQSILLQDNGIFAYIYVYGIMGTLPIVSIFIKILKYSWKIKTNMMPIMFSIFLILLSYNILFIWWKPDWTFIFIIFICYLEYKVFDNRKLIE